LIESGDFEHLHLFCEAVGDGVDDFSRNFSIAQTRLQKSQDYCKSCNTKSSSVVNELDIDGPGELDLLPAGVELVLDRERQGVRLDLVEEVSAGEADETMEFDEAGIVVTDEVERRL
jgi:hypothetical protein